MMENKSEQERLKTLLRRIYGGRDIAEGAPFVEEKVMARIASLHVRATCMMIPSLPDVLLRFVPLPAREASFSAASRSPHTKIPRVGRPLERL